MREILVEGGKKLSGNRVNKEISIVPLLEEYLTNGCTALSVRIVENDEVVFDFCEGHLNLLDKSPVLPSSYFDLASISKLYTTAIILRLCEKGKIKLETPISNYLNNFNGSKLTLIDLLTHHVKFDLLLSEYRKNFPDIFKVELLKIPVPDKASREINYHNLGFIYLGFIIELITNKSLHKNHCEFFEEFDLNNTVTGIKCLEQNSVASELISGVPLQGFTQDESAALLGGVAGNAGIFTNAEDLTKFGKAWIDGEVVGLSLLEKVFKNYDQTGNSPQGLGWWGRIPGKETFSSGIYCHPGYTGCLIAVNPKKRRIGTLLSNRTYLGRENKKHQNVFLKFIEQLAE